MCRTRLLGRHAVDLAIVCGTEDEERAHALQEARLIRLGQPEEAARRGLLIEEIRQRRRDDNEMRASLQQHVCLALRDAPTAYDHADASRNLHMDRILHAHPSAYT